MALIATLLFCTTCGDLLDRAASETIDCNICSTTNKNLWPKAQTVTSTADSFPSSLRRKNHSNIQLLSDAERNAWVKAIEECPECGKAELRFVILQLRSADEGSTVVYRCDGCGHRFNTNN